MVYIVEAATGEWMLVEDRSGQEYIDCIGQNVYRSVDFVTVARGDGDDILLMAAGLCIANANPFSQDGVTVLTQDGYSELIERRQREHAQATIDFPVEVREEQHG
jgi:hypothetical protein